MTTEKRKWPRAAAIQVARTLCEALQPHCEKLIVAGSLRRGRALVGDVEILYIPHTEERPIDLFHTRRFPLTDPVLDHLLKTEILAKRPSVTGSHTWGQQNKLAIHVPSGIPVDLFETTADCWFNYLVCRTGPAESNTRIATAAQERGWKWKPYSPGFTRLSDGAHHAVQSEEEVFTFVGLPSLPPHQR